MGVGLRLEGVSVCLGGRRTLLDVSASWGAGRRVCVMGKSGVGKTTLLRAIAGFVEIEGGAIKLEESELAGAKRGRVVLMFQKGGVFPWLSVGANARFAARFVDEASRLEVERTAGLLLTQVGLGSWEKQWPRELSGGMLQRLMLVRAVAAKPDVLLLDEPFYGLDTVTKLEVMNLVCGIQEEAGFLLVFVSHDLTEAAILGQEFFVLRGTPGTGACVLRVPGETREALTDRLLAAMT